MSVRYTRTRGGSLGGEPYFKMAAELKGIIEEELTKAGEEGAKEGERFIRQDAGTGKTWSRPWSDGRTGSSPGRVDSGLMADAMDFRIIRGQNVGLDVGWVRIWEKYFGAQEGGFTNGGSRTSTVVAGMGVMAHLRTFMRDKVDNALDRATERIVDGL